MSEIWKTIPGFEDAYEVSNLGRVRSLDRQMANGRRMHGRIIRRGPHRGGYASIHLYLDGKVTSTTAHALVALAFLGPRPPGMEVCHEDRDKQNCRLDNLRYDTHVANEADKLAHGTRGEGELSPSNKLTTAQVLDIRARRGVPQQRLADEYGCTFSNISAIQRRKSWRHV